MNRHLITLFAGGTLLASALSAGAAVNLLANPGFDGDGTTPSLAGWGTFNNALSSTVTPQSAPGDLKMYGNWSGPWNAAGVFQTFPATPGDTYALHVFARTNTGDALAAGNYVIEQLAFKDAANNNVGPTFETKVVETTSPLDTWLDPAPVQATVPAGATQVAAYLIFLQPNFGGGSALLDDASLTLVPEPASLSCLGLGALALLARRRRA